LLKAAASLGRKRRLRTLRQWISNAPLQLAAAKEKLSHRTKARKKDFKCDHIVAFIQV
jgi:hypothetical protein